MDPQTTWDLLLQAWSKRQWDEVSELSESLMAWLAKGGFPPETKVVDQAHSWIFENSAVNASFDPEKMSD